MSHTREEWASDFLLGVGGQDTKNNRQAINAWIQAEGGFAHYNPLNTTLRTEGSWDYNNVPVQNYPSYFKGLGAAVATLLTGAKMQGDPYGYRPILEVLREGTGARRVLVAVEKSEWGTSWISVACLPFVKTYWRNYKSKLIYPY